eukprot:jgi/Bigna1/76818/fgenesh1_pg.44_\
MKMSYRFIFLVVAIGLASANPLSDTNPDKIVCQGVQNATTFESIGLRTIVIVAHKTNGFASVTGEDIYIVEYRTHNPVCHPTSANRPNCTYKCSPYESPHTPNPSCISSPRLEKPQEADVEWVVTQAHYTSLGKYVAIMEPEAIGMYDLDIQYMIQGGLRAFYWPNSYMSGAPAVAHVDGNIDFNWGKKELYEDGPVDYVSVRWSGKLRQRNYTEAFTIFVTADDGVRVWIDKRLIIDNFYESKEEYYGTVNLVAGHFHDIIVEYHELNGNANIKLEWGSYSLPRQTIPSSSFWHPRHICGTPFQGFNHSNGPLPEQDMAKPSPRKDWVHIRPSWYPHLNHSYAYNFFPENGSVADPITGYGMRRAIAGQPTQFRIQLIDAFNHSLEGDPNTKGQIKLSVTKGPGNNMNFMEFRLIPRSVTLEPVNNAGVWQVNYTFNRALNFVIDVKINSSSGFARLPGSPFMVAVETAQTSVQVSYPFGYGLGQARAGPNHFFIVARDRFRNNRTQSGDIISVLFANKTAGSNLLPKNESLVKARSVLKGDVRYIEKGIYEIRYNPTVSGTLEAFCYMNGQLMKDMPKDIVVRSAPSHFPSTRIENATTRSVHVARAGVQEEIILVLKDRFGNHVIRNWGLPNVTLEFIGPKPWNLSNNATEMDYTVTFGEHKISYTVLVAGIYRLHIRIAGEEIADSPLDVVVHPNVADNHTVAAEARISNDDLLITKKGQVGVESFIYINAKDRYENSVDFDNSANISVVLTCHSTNVTAQYVRYLKQPEHPPGMHIAKIVPLVHGRHGRCRVFIRVNGEQITHSPFPVEIDEAPPAAANSIFEAITSWEAGQEIKFNLSAIDRFGNYREFDGMDYFGNVHVFDHTFRVDILPVDMEETAASVMKKGVMTLAEVHNHGNGTYEAAWTPISVGTYNQHVHLLARGVGLEAFYFPSTTALEIDNLASPHTTKIDPVLDFDLKEANILPNATNPFPADDWSVYWRGKLRFPKNASYRLTASIAANCGVRVWLGIPSNIQSGLGTNSWRRSSSKGYTNSSTSQHIYAFAQYLKSHDPIIDERERNEGGTDVFADVHDVRENLYYDFAVEFLDYEGDATFSLQWETISPGEPQIPLQVVPTSALSIMQNVSGSPVKCVTWNAPSSHLLSTTHPDGGLMSTYPLPLKSSGIPQEWDAGVTFTFNVQIRDQFGNLQVNGTEGGKLSVLLKEIYGASVVNYTSIVDHLNGTYTFVIEPLVSGTHELHVKFDGWPILGSPFPVEVIPGVAVTSTSNAVGVGLRNATVNYESRFEIFIRDIEGNLRRDADLVVCETTGPEPLDVNVSRVRDGIYSAKYTPRVKGSYTFQVKLNGVNLPPSFTVTVFPDRAIHNYTIYNINNGTDINKTANLLVTTLDNQNNVLETGGHFFYAWMVETYTGKELRGEVFDLQNGNYTISFPVNTNRTAYMLYILLASGRGIGDGLMAHYYTNPWLTGTPTLTRIDSHINFKWGQDLVAPTARDYVSIKWTGYIRPKYAQMYNFSLQADDGVRLTVDGHLIIDEYFNSASEFLGSIFSGNYTFPKPQMLYKFELEWRDTVDIALCILKWESPSQTKEIIPQDYFHSDAKPIINSYSRYTTTP